ncbi:MAG: hypothetical protein ACI84D_003522, partial [Thalassolituus oleivorans]
MTEQFGKGNVLSKLGFPGPAVGPSYPLVFGL